SEVEAIKAQAEIGEYENGIGRAVNHPGIGQAIAKVEAVGAPTEKERLRTRRGHGENGGSAFDSGDGDGLLDECGLGGNGQSGGATGQDIRIVGGGAEILSRLSSLD